MFLSTYMFPFPLFTLCIWSTFRFASQHLGRQALAAQIAADNDESADLLEDMPAPLGPLNKVWHEAEGCEGFLVFV